MKIFRTQKEIAAYFKEFRTKKTTVGFVPTMGALHKGHTSLIEQSLENNHITIASIFVNPTQFNQKEDLENYPRTLKSDLILLKKTNCDVLFIPSVNEIYSKNIVSNHFNFDGLDMHLEGKFRKGHFNGVGTIVKKLLEITMPNNAYFGEKDFQQLQIIRKMVEKNNLNVTIVSCPTCRENNGLAMSSRNKHLTKEERKSASIIYKILLKVAEKINTQSIDSIKKWVINEFKENPSFDIEYFVIADEETFEDATNLTPKKQLRAFIAVYAGTIRLIDNISLNS
tara:strand:- start:14229 stop:15077 length:849 start_codon:yes stop_codon:yes gene_type:complete